MVRLHLLPPNERLRFAFQGRPLILPSFPFFHAVIDPRRRKRPIRAQLLRKIVLNSSCKNRLGGRAAIRQRWITDRLQNLYVSGSIPVSGRNARYLILPMSRLRKEGNALLFHCSRDFAFIRIVRILLGCSQAVRHGTLIPICVGPNPATPACFCNSVGRVAGF